MRELQFHELLKSLQDLAGTDENTIVSSIVPQQTQELTRALSGLKSVDRNSVAHLIERHPEWVPLLATCVRLGDEQLKRKLRHGLGTSGWVLLARNRPLDLVGFLDQQFGLINALMLERKKRWTFADVLAERYFLSRRRASRAVQRGKVVEDAVEGIVNELDLPHAMRTRFVGGGGNSTGRKLTDAVREVEAVAGARLPRQFVFVVVDGIGWLGRQADLKRIYAAWVEKRIDGLYSLATLIDFRGDVENAAKILKLLPP